MMKLEPEKPPARGDLPAWLYPLLRRGLHSDARERFPSMQALVDQLEQKFDADRSKRRMRIVLAGGALAVASAAGITALVVAKRPGAMKEAAVCAAADMHLAGVWDNNVGAAVEKSFLATKRKYAADMWSRVDGALDRYAGAWTQMRKQACEATHVRKEQSAELLDLRMECLDRRLGELRSLTTLLAAADADVVDRAVGAALQLTPLDGCADSKRLREATPLPDNPEQRKQIEAVRTKLGDVQALRSAGKMNDAFALAEKTAAEARATNYRPVEAEALYWLGELQVDLGDPAESAKTLEAASVAAEAGRHDEIRARIAIALIYVQANLANYPAAYVAAERAAAVIERLGVEPKLEGKRLSELGNALWANGRYPEAREKLLAALALQERTLGPNHHEISTTLINLGNVADDLKQYEEAIGHYNRSLAIREKTFGAEHPSVAAAINNLGVVALHQQRVDEARKHYERALAIREAVFGPEHPLVAASLNNLGDALGSSGKLDEALTYFERALALREKLLPPDHPHLATTIYNVASVHMERKQPAKAVPLFERNLQILAKQMPADHPEVADAHYQLARAYRDSRKRGEAKQHFAAALEAWKKNPPDPAQLAEAQAGAR